MLYELIKILSQCFKSSLDLENTCVVYLWAAVIGIWAWALNYYPESWYFFKLASTCRCVCPFTVSNSENVYLLPWQIKVILSG